MADKKRLFGTFGVRRTANDVLTPEFASRLAASYGSIVQGTVAIGGDTRTSTPMLKYAISDIRLFFNNDTRFLKQF